MAAGPNTGVLEINGINQSISDRLDGVKHVAFVIIHDFDNNIDLTPLRKIENPFTVILEECRFDDLSLGAISESLL